MYRTLILASVLSLLVFHLNASAQPDTNDRSYDVVLQIVIGGGSVGQPLPQNLSAVAKQLRANYAFTDYRLANTYIGRVTNGGNFEYKSVSNVFGQSQEGDMPSFWEWSLQSAKVPNEPSRAGMFIHAFRFGARIPIRAAVPGPEAGRMPVVNYEPIGLNLQRFAIGENSPTVVGSLALPKMDGTAFLVLTLRPA